VAAQDRIPAQRIPGRGLLALITYSLFASLVATACAAPSERATVTQEQVQARVLDGTPTPTPTEQPPLTTAPLTYVAIGASDAFGFGTDHPLTENWPTVVAHRLSSSIHLINLGIPGATAELALRDETPIALDAQPDLITIWLGVNDLDNGVPLADFTRELRTLLGALRAGTSARIYVANLPDLSLLPYFAAKGNSFGLQAEVVQWNAAIAQATRDTGAALVNLFVGESELATHPEYISKDGFHPSTIGARRIAEVFLAAIEEGGL